MVRAEYRRRSARVWLALGASLLISLAGCTTWLASTVPDGSAEAAPDSRPPSAPEVAPSASTSAPLSVAILYSSRMPTQATIAGQIAEGLSGTTYNVSRVDIDGSGFPSRIDIVAEAEVRIVAAVGPAALNVARDRFVNAEIIFSQVLEPDTDAGATPKIRGVAATPPPAVQFAAWAEIDPGLGRIGLISSEAFAKVVPDAEAAAAAIGAKLMHRLSTSDRETLYLFRRLAPAIDGLWLAPDSQILSPAVIDEILRLAAELNIGVLVFSESLLDRGGLISVGASPTQIAATVIHTVERIRAGEARALPAEIPLDQCMARVNARVAARLGLPAATPTEWVIHAGY